MDKIVIILLVLIGIFIFIAFAVAIVYYKRKKRVPNASAILSKDQLLQLNEAFPADTKIIGEPYKVRKQMIPLSLIVRYYPSSMEKVDISTLKRKGIISKKVNKIGIYGGSSTYIPALIVETNYIDIFALKSIEEANGKVILKKMQ